MFDLLIRNGQVIDGSKGPSFKADVAIQGDTIVDVGNLGAADTARMIDAGEKAIAPGFIDIHSHGDFTLAACPTADSLIHQGVTTAVVGQCGLSLAPLLSASRDEVTRSMDTRRMPIPWDQWSDFKSYLDFMKAIGLSINIVSLVGQGTIRAGVMGFGSGRASPEQMRAMQAQAVKALEAGAIGISTGLVYPPGCYASTAELIELTKPVGQRRGFYFSHIRGEGQSLIEAVAEAIRIGRETGCAVQISHLKAAWPHNWEKHARAVQMIEQARLEGLDVNADVYPYLAGSTSLKSGLPRWAQEGGKEVSLRRLAEPGTRHKIAEGMKKEGLFQDGSWDKILISHSTRRPDYAGRYVTEMAAEDGKVPEEWVLDALLETELDPSMILFSISEANLKTALQNPAVMIGSDSSTIPAHGPLAEGVPHPRTFGTFPRVIARYVREESILSLEEAVHKMTGLSATKLRLSDRGLIKPGLKADLVVFDPKTIRDRATYEDPFHYPEGIFHVICNGTPIIVDGQATGARPGRVLAGG